MLLKKLMVATVLLWNYFAAGFRCHWEEATKIGKGDTLQDSYARAYLAVFHRRAIGLCENPSLNEFKELASE
ncbi:MAG: hypothetical protein EAZ10_12505 [Oscillatoriales cyanobacterium]|nr:MAG: hypothetical protein EAZ10_12505 [Oscillatoriales cyanobacterium]